MTFEKLGIAMTNYRALLCVVLLVGLPQALANEAPRPHILGIDSVRIAVSDMDAARRFYSDATGFDLECHRCETSPPPGVVILPSGQIIWLVSERPAPRSSLLTEVTFAVDNLEALKQVFDANKIVSKEELAPRRVVSIAVQDPEGHAVRFTKRLAKAMSSTESDAPLPKRLIHAGWVVSDPEAMDKFYQDVLGFHVYWYGGMKEGETNWVDMQVPDGTDWIEYMLNVPSNAGKHTLGVMNHIALGVPDVRTAANQLEKSGVKLTEPPKIGRDGKWQLNLYDPDETRVELMEFTPVEKPCCAEYTGPHPKP
jgi:catechol 2,3-dioxygenase-like lactoylglutathione lyase family enzyme